MQYSEAVGILRRHACMCMEHVDVPSLGMEMFFAGKRALDHKQIEKWCSEILECLEEVNLHWSGPDPGERTTVLSSVDCAPVYAMNQILDDIWRAQDALEMAGDRYGLDRKLLRRWYSALSSAWLMVLAGDIDSIKAELYYELISRDDADEFEWLQGYSPPRNRDKDRP